MDLATYFAAIPGFTELSGKHRLLILFYFCQQNGVHELGEADVGKKFGEGRTKPPTTLKQSLATLSKGNRAPLILQENGSYALSLDGSREVEDFLDTAAGIQPARPSLAKLSGKFSDATYKAFFVESLNCVQIGARRAAVILVWQLTIHHLEEFVLAHKLVPFNSAIAKKPSLGRLVIATKDDFREIKKEVEFIELLRSANVITNDVRKILDGQLGFRNTCGHPNTIHVPETKVVAFIEDLVVNVILKYPIGSA